MKHYIKEIYIKVPAKTYYDVEKIGTLDLCRFPSGMRKFITGASCRGFWLAMARIYMFLYYVVGDGSKMYQMKWINASQWESPRQTSGLMISKFFVRNAAELLEDRSKQLNLV